MTTLNKILTILNGPLKIKGLLGLAKSDGTPEEHDQIAGLPLGTNDRSSTGELGVKVITIGDTSGAGSGIPLYDYQAFTYIGSTNNISTIVYKSGGSGGTTVATQTFTYVGAGAANDDLVATITRS